MRVALVCPYDRAVPGGVQAQVDGLARSLTGLGHDITVLAPGAAVDGGVGRSFGFRVNGSVATMAPHPAAAWRTVSTLRRGRFDVVHLHEPLAPSITVPALLSRSAPSVGTFHAAGDQTPYRWFDRPLQRLARCIDAPVAVSEPAADLVRHHLGVEPEILFDGIDLHAFDAPGDHVPPSCGDGTTVLFLGRHEPRKGLDALLDAVALVPEATRVWIAGEGRDTERLRRRHGGDPRIAWLGWLSDAAKVRHLRDAAVLCVPSRGGESFGVVLLEAMAAGVPVVASDLPAYRATSSGGSAALLVPPGDPTALAGALRRVLTDPGLAHRLRACGRVVAADRSMDELARRYVGLYRRVIDAAANQRSR